MFTVCPKCALTLAVTATDLRVAQGYVRCGRCLNVFNALARLSEERPAGAPDPLADGSAGGTTDQVAALEESASPEPAASPEQALPEDPPAPSAIDDDTGEIEIELDPSIVVTSARAPAPPEGFAAHEAFERESDAPPSLLSDGTQPAHGTGHTPTSAPTPIGASTPPPAPLATRVMESRGPETSPAPQESPGHVLHDPAAPPAGAGSAAAEQAAAQQTNTAPEGHEGTFELETPRPRAGLGWKLAAGALMAALALQVINHYRDALAANPALVGPLSTVYSALGVKLAPRWNIHAYDVHQLGASVAGSAAGEIVVRASVKNSANRAQPLPLLRVTLQDRFGNRIAARDVPPGDYLPSSVVPSSLLAAGGRVDATMVFVDPGPQAVGFEIDACLRQQSGEVACAHGP